MTESELYKELGILTKDKDKWKESIPYEDTSERTSIFSCIKNSLEANDLREISKLQIRMNQDMNEIADLYKRYTDNQV